MKVTINAYIIAEQDYKWNEDRTSFRHEVVFKAWPCDVSGNEKTLVCEHDFEVEIPDGFDIRSSLVANLEEEKRKAAAEYQKRVTDLNAQIQSLLAIEA